MSELAESLEALATLLEADNPPAKKKHHVLLWVYAFQRFDRYGKPIIPVQINPGDTLYLQRPASPGAGNLRAGGPDDLTDITPDGTHIPRGGPGRPYGTALGTLMAGKIGELLTATFEKRWAVDGDPCEICIENEGAGWIGADEDFPSGDDEPPAHNHCMCDVEMRRAEEED